MIFFRMDVQGGSSSTKSVPKVHLEMTLEQFPVCCNKMTIKLARPQRGRGCPPESRVPPKVKGFLHIYLMILQMQMKMSGLERSEDTSILVSVDEET